MQNLCRFSPEAEFWLRTEGEEDTWYTESEGVRYAKPLQIVLKWPSEFSGDALALSRRGKLRLQLKFSVGALFYNWSIIKTRENSFSSFRNRIICFCSECFNVRRSCVGSWASFVQLFSSVLGPSHTSCLFPCLHVTARVLGVCWV